MTELRRTRAARVIECSIRTGILAVFVVGLRRRDLGAVTNALLALVGTALPATFERRYAVEFQPWQRVYADTAMFTHTVGMLGLYDGTEWWDHLTHTHSATLAGGLIHVIARRHGHDPRPLVAGGVAGSGVIWELAEYVIHAVAEHLGVEPVLVHYGKHDTLLDLAFDILGAVLVLAFGDSLLENFIQTAD